jgi:hypothetical protein
MYVDITGTDDERTVADVLNYTTVSAGTICVEREMADGTLEYVVESTPIHYADCEMADGSLAFVPLHLLQIS